MNVSKMDEQGKLDWLRAYERQNPTKYLHKFGKVIAKDGNGQPLEWEYVTPEEAVKALKPTRSFGSVLGVKVEVQEKAKVLVEKDFIDAPVGGAIGEVVKKGKKANV